MVTHPDLKKRDVSSLASLYSGGSHSSPELFDSIKETMKTTGAQNGYGATENFLACCNTGYDYDVNPGSVGIPCRHIHIKITNPEGTKELGPMEDGEIWVKSPTVGV
jgi:acyl-coenzyme A synthetase/AMP-(fatty) acid ligase